MQIIMVHLFGLFQLIFLLEFANLFKVGCILRRKISLKNAKKSELNLICIHPLKAAIHSIMLITTSSLLAYPPNYSPTVTLSAVNIEYQYSTEEWTRPTTYDEILQMLEDLESGALERKYSPMQLKHVNAYLSLLAQKGTLPGELPIEDDIEDLMYGEDSGFQLTYFLGKNHEYIVIPAVINSDSSYDIVQCGKISNAWKKTKKFTKKHKKAIIIGAVIVVAATAVVVAVAATGGAATLPLAQAGAAAAAGASAMGSASDSSPEQSPQEVPFIKSVIDEQISSFKETIVEKDFFPTPHINEQQESLPWEETGRVIGPLFAHETFNTLNHNYSSHPQFSQEIETIQAQAPFSMPSESWNHSTEFGHHEIDRRFSSDYTTLFPEPNKKIDLNPLYYQMRGEKALSLGYYGQASEDFTKTIELKPTDPLPYLQRSASHFNSQQYDKSINDFHQFKELTEASSQSIADLDQHFTMGLSEGVCESGKGILLFLQDFVSHPVHTTVQACEALSSLASLARNDEWGAIGQALSPEIYELVTNWDTLPPEKQAELAGHALGKHGTDILLPGGIAKVASKCAKSAKELAAVCKNLKIAKETLVLETAAEIGSGAQVGEIISSGRKTLSLGEELGFTPKEMGQLKQAGKLETTLQNTFDHLSLPKQESVKLFAEAESILKLHKGYMSEHTARELIHKTGIPTFPRPKGIPENYRVKLSNNGAGMKYVHPNNEQTYIRVMPGKPHSKYPHQQKPYVVQMKNGKNLDRLGNVVLRDTSEAHIPLEKFVFIGD